MAKRSKEEEPSTIRDVCDRLQGIGYRTTTVPGTPDGLTVFTAPIHSSGLRRLGMEIPRSYAICPLGDLIDEHYMIGWSHVIRRKGDTSIGDAVQLAVQNCLGRLTFLESLPGIRESYLKKIVGKFADSISAQSLPRPENS